MRKDLMLLVIAIMIGGGFLQSIRNAISVVDLESVVAIQAIQIKALEGRTVTTIREQITKPVEVTVTAYSPRVKETDSSPFKTAFNKEVKQGTIAVSRDLFLSGWTPGRKVYIYQIGVYTISDLMHHRKSSHLDVFFFSTKQALEFGIKQSRAILLEI
jgi:3D (Asp-Asp-Asp) domain-containing protein